MSYFNFVQLEIALIVTVIFSLIDSGLFLMFKKFLNRSFTPSYRSFTPSYIVTNPHALSDHILGYNVTSPYALSDHILRYNVTPHILRN